MTTVYLGASGFENRLGEWKLDPSAGPELYAPRDPLYAVVPALWRRGYLAGVYSRVDAGVLGCNLTSVNRKNPSMEFSPLGLEMYMNYCLTSRTCGC